jgi:serine/threonine protein kinase
MLEIGRIIEGRWRVEAEIGEGGVARVYRVRNTRLDTLHALKVLRIHSTDIARRLSREGQVQAKLHHENVLEVTDVFDIDGAPGLLMRYVDGPPLSRWLTKNRPTVPEAEALFRGILAGVARAHSVGIIHRDLKPGNVLLAWDGARLVPKVADFGLAKVLAEDLMSADTTRSGMAMGTPAYMAPEQFRGLRDIDQRADIFALGCILYELVCGQRPYEGEDLFTIQSAIAAKQYVPPERLVPTLPRHLAQAIQASLEPNRDARPEHCETLFTMLDKPEYVWTTPGSGLSVASSTMVPDPPSQMPPFLNGGPPSRPTNVPTSPSPSQPTIDAQWSDPLDRTPRGESTAGKSLAPLMGRLFLVGVGGAVMLTLLAVVAVVAFAMWKWGPRAHQEPAVVQPVVLDEPVAPVEAEPVEPEPTIVATPPPVEPAPAPVKSTPRSKVVPKPTGSVRIGGDATAVVLIAEDGRQHGAGALAPGVYDVRATFADGTTITRADLVEVRVGATVAVRCQSDVENCFRD